MSSLFDPKSFLSATLNEANSTKVIPLPIGETFGQITAMDIQTGEKDGKSWYRLSATLEITDSEYLAKWQVAGAEKAKIDYRFLLDVNEGGGIAMGPGKNVKLGRLREAAGVNQPGKSLDMMVGQIIRVSIGNRPDPNDPETIYADVTAVAKY